VRNRRRALEQRAPDAERSRPDGIVGEFADERIDAWPLEDEDDRVVGQVDAVPLKTGLYEFVGRAPADNLGRPLARARPQPGDDCYTLAFVAGARQRSLAYARSRALGPQRRPQR
jgi:hypothetical protein